MSRKKAPQGQRRCKQCKETKPVEQFLFHNRRDVFVGFCNTCSQRNMERYWKMRATVTDPRQIALDARE